MVRTAVDRTKTFGGRVELLVVRSSGFGGLSDALVGRLSVLAAWKKTTAVLRMMTVVEWKTLPLNSKMLAIWSNSLVV